MGGAWNTLKTNIGLTKKEWEEKDRNKPENVAARESLDKQKKQWAENDRKYQEQQEQSKNTGSAYGHGHSAQDEYNATQNNVKKALAESSRGPGLQNVGVTTSTQNKTNTVSLYAVANDYEHIYTPLQKQIAYQLAYNDYDSGRGKQFANMFASLSAEEQQQVLAAPSANKAAVIMQNIVRSRKK